MMHFVVTQRQNQPKKDILALAFSVVFFSLLFCRWIILDGNGLSSSILSNVYVLTFERFKSDWKQYVSATPIYIFCCFVVRCVRKQGTYEHTMYDVYRVTFSSIQTRRIITSVNVLFESNICTTGEHHIILHLLSCCPIFRFSRSMLRWIQRTKTTESVLNTNRALSMSLNSPPFGERE